MPCSAVTVLGSVTELPGLNRAGLLAGAVIASTLKAAPQFAALRGDTKAPDGCRFDWLRLHGWLHETGVGMLH